jgi:hypothetical protein
MGNEGLFFKKLISDEDVLISPLDRGNAKHLIKMNTAGIAQ